MLEKLIKSIQSVWSNGGTYIDDLNFTQSTVFSAAIGIYSDFYHTSQRGRRFQLYSTEISKLPQSKLVEKFFSEILVIPWSVSRERKKLTPKRHDWRGTDLLKTVSGKDSDECLQYQRKYAFQRFLIILKIHKYNKYRVMEISSRLCLPLIMFCRRSFTEVRRHWDSLISRDFGKSETSDDFGD